MQTPFSEWPETVQPQVGMTLEEPHTGMVRLQPISAQVVEQSKRKRKYVLLAAAAVLLFLVVPIGVLLFLVMPVGILFFLVMPMGVLLAAVICLVVFLVKRKKRNKAATGQNRRRRFS